MAIIHTKQNTVYAYDPQPGDVLVHVGWSAPGDDGMHRRTISLPYRPINEYAAAVDWATNIADKMVYPIHVLPLNHRDFFNTGRFDPYRRFLANLSDQERGEIRQIIVGACAEIMRGCDNAQVRADAYDVLVLLKVVHG